MCLSGLQGLMCLGDESIFLLHYKREEANALLAFPMHIHIYNIIVCVLGCCLIAGTQLIHCPASKHEWWHLHSGDVSSAQALIGADGIPGESLSPPVWDRHRFGEHVYTCCVIPGASQVPFLAVDHNAEKLREIRQMLSLLYEEGEGRPDTLSSLKLIAW